MARGSYALALPIEAIYPAGAECGQRAAVNTQRHLGPRPGPRRLPPRPRPSSGCTRVRRLHLNPAGG